jgi:hypothetical protein
MIDVRKLRRGKGGRHEMFFDWHRVHHSRHY